MRIIIDGPPEHALEALKVGLKARGSLEADYAKVGYGWGYSSSVYPEASFFVRKTKAGFSVHVTTKAPA